MRSVGTRCSRLPKSSRVLATCESSPFPMEPTKTGRSFARLLRQLLPKFPPTQFRIDKLVEFASIQNAFHVRRFDAGADVFHAAIVENVVPDLVAPRRVLRVADGFFQLGISLGLLQRFDLAL